MIQAEFAKLVKKHKTSRTGLFLLIPLVLLALRSAVEDVVRAMFPLWAHTLEGYQALEHMDQVCCPVSLPLSHKSWLCAPRSVGARPFLDQLCHHGCPGGSCVSLGCCCS
jgi:hypothetical protein